MKYLVTMLLVYLSFHPAAQPSITWQKALGGTLHDVPMMMVKTSDGGFIIGGSSESKDGDITGAHGNYDLWVVKMGGQKEWKKNYGGSNADWGSVVMELPDYSGYILAGTTESNNGDVKGNHGNKDIWVLRIDLNGDIIWQRTIGGNRGEQFADIKFSSTGDLFVASFTTSSNADALGNHGAYDILISKMSVVNGSILKNQLLGGSADERVDELQATPDGGCIISGTTYSNNGNVTGFHGVSDAWVVKLKNDFSIEWSRSLGGSNRESSPVRIKPSSDGSYFVTAVTSSIDGDVNNSIDKSVGVWAMKLNANGELVNQYTDVKGLASMYDLRTTKDGGMIMAHHGFIDPANPKGGFMLTKLDQNLNLQWQYEGGGNGEDIINVVQELGDGNYLTYGYSSSTDIEGSKGNSDIWLSKISSNGSKIWEKLYGGFEREALGDPLKTQMWLSVSLEKIADDNGNIFFVSPTYSNNTGDLEGAGFHYNARVGLKNDIWAVRLSETAIQYAPVVLQPPVTELNTVVSVFPNPTKAKSTISIKGQENGNRILEIYSLDGRLIQRKVLDDKAFTIEVDLSKKPAGTYFYRLRSGGNDIQSGKLIKSD